MDMGSDLELSLHDDSLPADKQHTDKAMDMGRDLELSLHDELGTMGEEDVWIGSLAAEEILLASDPETDSLLENAQPAIQLEEKVDLPCEFGDPLQTIAGSNLGSSNLMEATDDNAEGKIYCSSAEAERQMCDKCGCKDLMISEVCTKPLKECCSLLSHAEEPSYVANNELCVPEKEDIWMGEVLEEEALLASDSDPDAPADYAPAIQDENKTEENNDLFCAFCGPRKMMNGVSYTHKKCDKYTILCKDLTIPVVCSMPSKEFSALCSTEMTQSLVTKNADDSPVIISPKLVIDDCKGIENDSDYELIILTSDCESAMTSDDSELFDDKPMPCDPVSCQPDLQARLDCKYPVVDLTTEETYPVAANNASAFPVSANNASAYPVVANNASAYPVAADNASAYPVVVDVEITGQVAADVEITGQVAADVEITGQVEADVEITGQVEADVEITGQVAADVDITGQVAADVEITGQVAADNASAKATASRSVHFVSNDPAENADNNSADWAQYRNLSSDEQMFMLIRETWGNETLPNPNADLTIRHVHAGDISDSTSDSMDSDSEDSDDDSKADVTSRQARDFVTDNRQESSTTSATELPVYLDIDINMPSSSRQADMRDETMRCYNAEVAGSSEPRRGKKRSFNGDEEEDLPPVKRARTISCTAALEEHLNKIVDEFYAQIAIISADRDRAVEQMEQNQKSEFSHALMFTAEHIRCHVISQLQAKHIQEKYVTVRPFKDAIERVENEIEQALEYYKMAAAEITEFRSFYHNAGNSQETSSLVSLEEHEEALEVFDFYDDMMNIYMEQNE